ncbi:hypothetical protein [Marinilabilia rubra]|uniref:Uncharacterized protein n=1 Tax=Marinilabilia rubra TaxID=2162893 RepID=A0A2U2B6F3_9BACT|nr:hypothetical protein [Marinilabilia rubra]PWD98614.1 hypothetical protein DDZ16_14220 [Marinilabilia rubra]
MTKDVLTESANHLSQACCETIEEYKNKSSLLVSKMNASMLKKSNLINIVGSDNIEMMKDNHANHVQFISSILKYKNTAVLIETIIWVFRTYRSHGFSIEYWSVQLNEWINILKEELSQNIFDEIIPYYKWMLLNIPSFVLLSEQNT